jgi:hypothetical protein
VLKDNMDYSTGFADANGKLAKPSQARMSHAQEDSLKDRSL